MILKILAVIVALVTVSPLAMASTADGPYVGLGMGFYNTDLKVTSGVTKVVFGDDKHDVGADVFAGYKWNMGTGSISTEASYTSSYGKATNVALGANTLSSELKNGMAISVLPGYALSKETTAFVRVGYTRVKGELTIAGTVSGSASENFNGAIYGFGVDHSVSQNVALRAEYRVLDNLSKTVSGVEYAPRATGVTLAIRYAF